MRKKPHDRILRKEPKEQHINTILKSCSYMCVCVCVCVCV